MCFLINYTKVKFVKGKEKKGKLSFTDILQRTELGKNDFGCFMKTTKFQAFIYLLRLLKLPKKLFHRAFNNKLSMLNYFNELNAYFKLFDHKNLPKNIFFCNHKAML